MNTIKIYETDIFIFIINYNPFCFSFSPNRGKTFIFIYEGEKVPLYKIDINAEEKKLDKKNPIVAQRLKRVPAIIYKLQRRYPWQ